MDRDAAAARRNGWEHFPHGADIGVRGYGATEAEAFAQAATALCAIVTDPHNVAESEAVDVTCAAPDAELLLVDWLNALIYEMATRKMCFGRFDVRLDDGRLQGRAWGEPLDVARHEPTVEPKGATYTALRVAREPTGRWVAQCVVDV
jgi:tRNA nucleotidyltransferase (CCA-adding enzyme)